MGCWRHSVTSLKLSDVKRWQLRDLITAAIVNNSTSLAYTPRLSCSLPLSFPLCVLLLSLSLSLSVCLLVSFSVRVTPAVRASAVSGLRKWRQVWRHYNAKQVRLGSARRPSTNRHNDVSAADSPLSSLPGRPGRSLQFNKTIAACPASHDTWRIPSRWFCTNACCPRDRHTWTTFVGVRSLVRWIF